MGMIKSLLAALMMFTRIPLWRLTYIDKKYYTSILLYWPLIGFVTGAATWGVVWLTAHILPMTVACILAIIFRLLLTGALHEDGLADFFDGFGGGNGKEKILSIMKDSHIGSYGVIGLIVYFILYASLLYASSASAGIIIGADVFSKLCTAVMINTLSYARTEESSKVKVLYRKIRPIEFLLLTLCCLIPLWLLSTPWMALLPTILSACGLRWYFYKKIAGYTGDCCGAAVLINEQFYYIGAIIIYTCGL